MNSRKLALNVISLERCVIAANDSVYEVVAVEKRRYQLTTKVK